MIASLTINGEKVAFTHPVEQVQLAIANPTEFLEIWLVRKDRRTMSALINATHAFLVWMTPDCPEGWHSASDDSSTEWEMELSFRLGNGQVDVFPEETCVTRAQVVGAFQEFWATGGRPASIQWRYT